MKAKLNTTSAFLVVLFYLVFSIIASLLAAIFFGGVEASDSDTLINGVIDSGMYANLIVMIVLILISLYIFKESRKDIFFERKPFA